MLSSGRASTLYIDARLTTMSAEGLALIGPLALSVLRQTQWNVDEVGGLTLGADPISYAIAYASTHTDRPVQAFSVRKQAKQHGTQRRIEGPFDPAGTVAIIEDVITTGGSALQAIAAVRETGAHIAGVLALVDREEGGREAIEGAGVPVVALARAAEILARMS